MNCAFAARIIAQFKRHSGPPVICDVMRKENVSISKSEELLFEKWEGGREGFVRDGVVSENDYLSSRLKIVFILKEVNDLGGGDWDLRKFIFKGGRPQTWDNITRWVNGIRNLDAIPDWKFYSEITKEFRIETLKNICVMNLKKSPGTHTANHAAIKTVANEDKNYIRSQYSIYDADLTICGGTGKLFKSVAGHDSKQWRTTKRGIRWYERDIDKYVVSFGHPEARVQNSLLVYGLLDAVYEIYA